MKKVNRFRKRMLTVYLTDEEAELLEEKVAKLGFTKSHYCRMGIILGADKRYTRCPPEAADKLLREMKRIGDELNQIAKAANTNKTVSKADILRAMELLEDLNEIEEVTEKKIEESENLYPIC